MDKQTQVVMFSSKTGNWATPQDFFNKLDWRFGPFTLDPCASSSNTKCANFIKGRLKFGDSANSAPFPSAVVVFDGRGDLWRVEGINK